MADKRALVLGGGGAKGAFQAGVIYNLAQKTSWDTVFGVSAGAINGAAIAMYNKDDVIQAVEKLLTHWKEDISESNVYKKWFCIEAINYAIAYWKNGLYNTDPLKKFLYKNLDEKLIKSSDVDYFLGTTSFTTGAYKLVNKREESLIEWILASASFPMAFPPIKIEGEFFIDGAIRNCVPIKDALATGAKHIDVIINDPFGGHVKTNKKPDNVLDVFVRTAEILSDEVFISDLRECCEHYNATIAIYSPEHYLTDNPLDFSYKKVNEMLEKGLKVKEPFLIEQSH